MSCLVGLIAGDAVPVTRGRRTKPAFPQRGQMVTSTPVVSRRRSCQVLGDAGTDGKGGMSAGSRIFCLANSSLVVAFEEECRP